MDQLKCILALQIVEILLRCLSFVTGDIQFEHFLFYEKFSRNEYTSVNLESSEKCCATCIDHGQCESVTFDSQRKLCRLFDKSLVVDSDATTTSSGHDTSFVRVFCPSGWILYKGRCYLVVTTKMTWPAAESNCVELGSHLVDIQNEAENTFVFNLVTSKVGYIEDYWLGLVDYEQNRSFVYSSGAPYLYNNFRNGEPSFTNVHGRIEDCIVVWYENPLKWNDVGCTVRPANSVCKMNSQ